MNRFRLIALFTLASASLWASDGFGLGIQTSFQTNDQGALVPRADFLRITDSSNEPGPFNAINLSTTANIFSLGVDYDYYLTGAPGQGCFLLGGVGLAAAAIEVSGSTPGASASTTSHQTLLFPEAGVGYQFTRHVGVEVVYRDLNFKDVDLAVAGVPVGYSFSGGLEAAVVCRL